MLAMNSEYDDQSEDKNDSEDSQLRISEKAEKVIVELNLMYGESKKKILELIQVLRTEDKLKDNEIKKVLFAKVNFVSKATLYRALPQEFKKEYTAKPLPKTINISTPHKVIEPIYKPSGPFAYPKETEKIGEIRIKKEEPLEVEDPKDLEIQFLKEKVAELEDALKKTEQFKPATQLQPSPPPISNPDEHYFKWLADRDNGVSCYWYPNYGIELFRNRILTQLKNKGVTTFKRFYFEV